MTYQELLDILGLPAEGLSSKRIAALQVLASGKVPAHAVKERDARAGKRLKYYSHRWARQLLREGLGIGLYSLETLETEYSPGPGGGVEGSTASAMVRLTIYTKDGCTIVAEPGVFDNTQKYNRSSAKASAASRGVCRCVMQAFGLGAEWYNDGEGMGSHAAWASIKAQASVLGLAEEAVQAELKARGFIGDVLGRRYAEAMQAVQEMANKAVLADPIIEVAKELGGEISHEEADLAVATEGNATADNALVEAVATVENWGEFYALLQQTLKYPNTTAAQYDINAIFGSSRPQRDEHPDWSKIYNALREWKDVPDLDKSLEGATLDAAMKARDEALQAVKDKYNPSE